MDDPALFILFILVIFSFYYVIIRPVLNFHTEREIYAMKSRRYDPDYDYHGNRYMY